MKIAVLISGGVDSSVALLLSKEKWGKDNIEAFYIKIWLEDELSYLGNCPWQEDLFYVEAVCKKLDIKLNVVSLQKEYFKIIVEYTINQIKSGKTPNPDILCNKEIKFGAFFDKYAKDFDFIATGHYAQIEKLDDKILLTCSKDVIKDQTYFLSFLNKDQISRILFPIGHLSKSEVRKIAQDYDLPNKLRKDSQGLCFLGKLKFNDFVKAYLGEKTGDLIEFETGKKLGEHKGFWFYTIGQRKAIGLSAGPWYVVSKDIEKNIVYISCNYKKINKDSLIISSLNWIDSSLENDISNKIVYTKLRHGPKFYKSKLIKVDLDSYKIILDETDHAITSGQFAVIYYENRCILSGVIN